MPFDRSEVDEDENGSTGGAARLREFDCPICNANNPYDDPFGDGDEVRCFYCGQAFQARVSGGGRVRLREL